MISKHQTILDKLNSGEKQDSEKVKALKECLADLDEAELTVNDLDETLIDLEKTVEALEQKL